jgi:exodeoxyribonuclease VII large subunit
MIAGQNKITPTDVAYFLIQRFHNFAARIEESRLKIITLSQEILEEGKRGWGEISKKFLLLAENKMRLEKGFLEQISGRMITESRTMLATHRHVISLAESRLRFKPGLLIREKGLHLENKSEWFAMRVSQLITKQHVIVDKFEQQLQLLDPQKVLSRGYSITFLAGKPVTDAALLNNGDMVTTRLCKGNIYSEIKSKKE